MCVWARGQETTWLGFLLKAGSSIFTLKESWWGLEREPPTAVITTTTVKWPDTKWYQVFRTKRTAAACPYLRRPTARDVVTTAANNYFLNQIKLIIWTIKMLRNSEKAHHDIFTLLVLSDHQTKNKRYSVYYHRRRRKAAIYKLKQLILLSK